MADQTPTGAQTYQAMLDSGVNPDQANAWRSQNRQAMVDSGIKPDDIASYWGDAKPYDTTGIANQIAGTLDTIPPEQRTTRSAIAAGFNNSIAGIALTQGQGPRTLEQHGFFSQLMEAATQTVLDLPFNLAAGAAAAGATTEMSPPVAAVIGGAAAMGAPAAFRDALILAYSHGDGPKTAQEFWGLAAKTGWDVASQAIAGAAGGLVGHTVAGAVGAKVGEDLINPATGESAGKVNSVGARAATNVAEAAAFAGSATAVGALMQGHVPDAQDFFVGAILALGGAAGGMVGSGKSRSFVPNARGLEVAANLRQLYKDKGLNPVEVAQRIHNGDNALASEVFAPRTAAGTPSPAPVADSIAPPEPEPALNPRVSTPDPVVKPTTTNEVTGEATPVTSAKLTYGGGPQGGDLDVKGLNPDFSKLLQGAGADVGFPELKLTSGYRPATEAEALANGVKTNAQRGGVEGSFHQVGKAADVSTVGWTQTQKENFIRAARARGATGFGIDPRGDIHVDMGHGSLTLWAYDERGNPNQAAPPWAQTAAKGIAFVGAGFKPYTDAEAAAVAAPKTMTAETVPDAYTDLFQKLEGTADSVTNNKSARGRFQITADTAKTYGIDYDRLTDPVYAKAAAKKILADLSRQFNGKLADMAVAYNAGPGVARTWIRNGRDIRTLPQETQRYLLHGEVLGAWDGGWNNSLQQAAEHAQPGAVDYTGFPPDTAFGSEPRPDVGAETYGGVEFRPPSTEEPGNPSAGTDLVPRETNSAAYTPPVPEIDSPVGQAKLEGGFGITDESALQLLQEGIDNSKKGQWLPDWLNPKKFFSQFFAMAYDPIRAIDKSEGTNFLSWFQWASSAGNRAALYMRDGFIKGGASYPAAYRAAAEDGGNSRDFGLYRIAKKVQGYAARGIDLGFDQKAAGKIATSSDMIAKYERANKIIQKFHDDKIDYAVMRGLISQGSADRMKANDIDYVLLKRVQDSNYNPVMPGSMSDVRNLFKRIQGSERLVIDPLTAEIDNTRAIIQEADRNLSKLQITSYIKQQLLQKQAQTEEAAQTISMGFRRVEDGPLPRLPDNIYDAAGNEIKVPAEDRNLFEGLMAAMKGPKAKGSPDDFYVYDKGKLERWQADNPDLADLMNMQWGASKLNPVATVMTKIAGLARAGIIGDLSFFPRVFIHSNFAASVLAKDGGLPFFNSLKGVISSWTKPEQWDAFMREQGGATAVDMDRHWNQRDLTRQFEDTGVAGAVWNTVKHPIDAYRTLESYISNASRFGYSLRQQARGVDEFTATSMSRAAYLDFQEPFKSSWVQTFSRMVPFMSAGFKDIRQFTEAFKDGRALTTFARGAAIITMPTVINYAVNYMADKNLPDGEKYTDYPRWERDMYWIMPPIGGVRMKIKKPYVVAFPFSTVPERFMDWLVKSDPRAAEEMMSSAVAQMVPPMVPTAMNPIAETVTNHSMLTGRPLISARNESLSNWLQSVPNTSVVAKTVARVLGPAGMNVANVSPIHLDTFAAEWGGTIVTSALKAMNAAFQPATPHELADMPFVSSFLARNPNGGQAVDDFYAAIAEMGKNNADFKLAIAQGDTALADQLAASSPIVRLAGWQNALTKLSAYIRAINNDKDMAVAEKRQFTDQAYENMAAFSKAGLQMIDEMKANK